MADEITPAEIPDSLASECQMLSSKIYDALDCIGIVRVDYIYSGEALYFLEINTVPGMTAESVVPRQIRASGEKLQNVLVEVIRETMQLD